MMMMMVVIGGDGDVITIRQGPVVHVVEPAVVLGAGGGAEVQVGPGVEVDEVEEEHKEMILSMMIFSILK